MAWRMDLGLGGRCLTNRRGWVGCSPSRGPPRIVRREKTDEDSVLLSDQSLYHASRSDLRFGAWAYQWLHHASYRPECGQPDVGGMTNDKHVALFATLTHARPPLLCVMFRHLKVPGTEQIACATQAHVYMQGLELKCYMAGRRSRRSSIRILEPRSPSQARGGVVYKHLKQLKLFPPCRRSTDAAPRQPTGREIAVLRIFRVSYENMSACLCLSFSSRASRALRLEPFAVPAARAPM